jgi:LCP family protein required for cell wall assembly
MSRFERFAFVLLLLIAIGLWALIGLNVTNRNWWTSPLGPQLALPFLGSARATETARAARAAAGPTTTLIPGQPTLTPFIPNINGVPQCGGPLTLTILAVASDTRAPGYLYGLADVIRLVRVDFVTPRVTVLDIPRDIWVEIPDISEHYGIDHGKLNQAYLYGNRGMGYYNGPDEGPGLLARTLDLNFGARPDNYVAVNMQTFVKVVDVIGGIDVNLPITVDGRKADQGSRSDLYFKAGHHHLNGQQALMLARIRQQSTYERADNQNIVLCAVRDALLNPYNLPKIPEIIKTFDGAVQTDLSPQQLSQLACILPKLDGNSIAFITFPRELLKEARTYDIGVKKDVFIYEADFNVLRQYVSAFNTGIWPELVIPSPVTATPGSASSGGGFTCP